MAAGPVTDRFDLLLVGGGHAHLGVLRQWLQQSVPAGLLAGRIGLLNPGPYAWYSGMLPGLLAGRYQPEQCRVSLAELCRALGVELISGSVASLKAQTRELTLEDGRQLSANWLSLNVGSLPKPLPTEGADMQVLPVKPFGAFLECWQYWQASPQPLAILGGGAAGVELALAMAAGVPQLTLISAGQLLAGHPPKLRERALRHLARAGVQVQEGVAVDVIRGDSLWAGEQQVWNGPRLILATGASALPWSAATGLACDPQGFIRIGATLQSESHPQLFATGDCASLNHTLRNGVYAVRQGPVLAFNLAAALSGQPLQAYLPQRRTLALLADGQGGALLSWAQLTAEGRWLGRWKDQLDRRFIRRHQRP